MLFLGADTSNYTTSVAIYDTESGKIIQKKKLLPVKSGELGIRQSDAVFHHTRQLPEMMEALFSEKKIKAISAVCASTRPRNIDGSYMPCFLVGEGFVRSYSAASGIKAYYTSHQVGHILAAVYSSEHFELLNTPFLAFHISGGTTDLLYCEPNEDEIIKITEAATSLDLKAGQAVDRVGVMLGLDFPCGKELEKLAVRSKKDYKIKAVIKDGCCCLSGIENKCRSLLDKGEEPENIAKYCLCSIYSAVREMTVCAIEKYGKLPIIYAGGVMSDALIRERLESEFGAYFAEPNFSCDNAAGCAVFAAEKYKKEYKK